MQATTRTFRVLITKTEEDDGYMATIPSLNHCFAFGDTPEESLHNLQEALEGVLETMAAHGLPIPDDSLSLETTITVPLANLSLTAA